MNIKRVVSALLGMPLVIIVLLIENQFVVDVVFAAIALICIHEFYKSFTSTGKAKPVAWIGYLSTIMIATTHIFPEDNLFNLLGLTLFLSIFLLFIQVFREKANITDVSITMFGICYITIFWMFIPLIRGLHNGQYLVWYVLAAGWGCDVLAYIVGKTMGKHKFCKISPNKTIEGSIAGVLGSVIFMLIFTYIFNNVVGLNISYIVIIFIAIILSIVGQLGDLAASSIKRYVGIKDYSHLIPGHGGMLDRVDSIIFIAPVAYFLLTLI